MARTDRLYAIIDILRDGALHRAADLSRQLDVSERTLYRDMDTLIASGFPVIGTRGAGYRMTDDVSLPPLTLTPKELEALQLGLAITAEAADDDLKSAARTLAAKCDAALPQQAITDADRWKFNTYPFGDMTRGVTYMQTLRAAIRGKQKLRLTYTSANGTVTSRVIWPLSLEYLGRVWILTAWCELRHDFRHFRLDLVDAADPLPTLFRDTPGRTLADINR